jgi:hypothetical protein
MNVDRGLNDFVEMVLKMGKPVGKLSFVMVVHKGDRPDNLPVRIPTFLNEPCANQVPEKFRAITVFAPGDQSIELVEELPLERDARSDEV